MSVPVSVCPLSELGAAPATRACPVWMRWAAQCLTAPAAAPWSVSPCSVVSLHPKQPGTLMVSAGQVWVTLCHESVPAHADATTQDGASRDSGDHFLQAGDSLSIAAGQHVVVQAVGMLAARGFLQRVTA